MHVYEFEPRILANKNEVEMAVRGEKLSFPGMDSRWTERLRPGLSEFAELEDEEELEEVSYVVCLQLLTILMNEIDNRLTLYVLFQYSSTNHRQ